MTNTKLVSIQPFQSICAITERMALPEDDLESVKYIIPFDMLVAYTIAVVQNTVLVLE